MALGGRLLGNFTLNSSGYIPNVTYVQLSSSGTSYSGISVYAYNGGSQPLMLGNGPTSGAVSPVCQILPGNGAYLQGVQVPAGALWLKSLGTTGQASGIVSVDIYG